MIHVAKQNLGEDTNLQAVDAMQWVWESRARLAMVVTTFTYCRMRSIHLLPYTCIAVCLAVTRSNEAALWLRCTGVLQRVLPTRASSCSCLSLPISARRLLNSSSNSLTLTCARPLHQHTTASQHIEHASTHYDTCTATEFDTLQLITRHLATFLLQQFCILINNSHATLC